MTYKFCFTHTKKIKTYIYISEEKLLSGWMRWPFITPLPMNQVTLQNQSLIHLIPLFFHLSHIMIIKLTAECPKMDL